MTRLPDRLRAALTSGGLPLRLPVSAAFLVATAMVSCLAVLALALFLASSPPPSTLPAAAPTAVVVIPAGEDPASQLATAQELILATPGVAGLDVMEAAAQRRLLSPWFGPDAPVDLLPLPAIIEITLAPEGADLDDLQARLATVLPSASLELPEARPVAPTIAPWPRWPGLALCLVLWLTLAAAVSLTARATLASEGAVIDVLRLIGATDTTIVRAFQRPFALRALASASVGTVVGLVATQLSPAVVIAGETTHILRFEGASVLWIVAIPLVAAVTAVAVVRSKTLHELRQTT